jgi:ribosomal protein S18 acetylase RimI-like enzyme
LHSLRSTLPADPRTSVRIVPIAEAHIEGFHAALDVVAKERRYLAFLEAPSLEETGGFVRRNIAKGYPQCVALVDGTVVGWCDILPVDRPTMAHGGVLGVGVLPDHRGKGIGTALVRAALQMAKAAGLTRVELTVRAQNARAIVLYERLGFVREGVKRHAVRVDGRDEDLVCMGLVETQAT